ncbi:UPF0691 protein [Galemys pyrenaicus]|uniref:UPF0691 protein n=1 Tax=Galemys pyrenaicus TaxID=202257 RepID=A0A8J6AH11_GALPY|nr:UPF0691 protein [Galemys pyrenaicus]
MSQEGPPERAEPAEPAARPPAPPAEKTSDFYRVSEDLPARFNNPACFRGYGSRERASVYRTSNQDYGSRAPTVHEMPKVFYPNSSKFSRQRAAGGVSQSHALNVGLDRSLVTGPSNHISPYDRLNFHPSFNVRQPSICS